MMHLRNSVHHGASHTRGVLSKRVLLDHYQRMAGKPRFKRSSMETATRLQTRLAVRRQNNVIGADRGIQGGRKGGRKNRVHWGFAQIAQNDQAYVVGYTDIIRTPLGHL